MHYAKLKINLCGASITVYLSKLPYLTLPHLNYIFLTSGDFCTFIFSRVSTHISLCSPFVQNLECVALCFV